jgi:hypothetical protein
MLISCRVGWNARGCLAWESTTGQLLASVEMIGGSSQSRVDGYRDQSVRDEKKERKCGDLPLIVATCFV